MALVVAQHRHARPQDIYFTAHSIRATFERPRDRDRIEDVAALIIEGELSPRAFPPINVVEHGENLWTLDNKRLWVFRTAEVCVVPINVIDPSEKLLMILASPELYNLLADPNFVPTVWEKESLLTDVYKRRKEYAPSPAPPPSIPEKRKYFSHAEKHILSSQLPSCQQHPESFSRKKVRALTWDDDGLSEGGRDDRVPSPEAKLPPRKGNSISRSDANLHPPTGLAPRERGGTTRAMAAACSPPFYKRKRTVPEETVLGDSSSGHSPIGATSTGRHRKVKNTRAKGETALSDEEATYGEDAAVAATEHLSDMKFSKYHVGRLNKELPRKNVTRSSSSRPAHRQLPVSQEAPKRGTSKIGGTRVKSAVHTVFPDLERHERHEPHDKPSSVCRRKDAGARAHDKSGKKHGFSNVLVTVVATPGIGRAKFDASSSEEAGPVRPQKSWNEMVSRKRALPGDHRDKAGATLKFSPASTPEHGDGTCARTRGFVRFEGDQKGKESHAVEVEILAEPLLSHDLKRFEKYMPIAAAPNTPDSVKNENKISNITNGEPSDAPQGSSQSPGRRPILYSTACQTENTLLEDPDDVSVLKSKKKRKLVKSGVEVRKVDTTRPKQRTKTLKSDEVSRKHNRDDGSARAKKLSSSEDEALTDCPIKADARTDELEKMRRSAKLESPHSKLGAVSRSAQSPPYVGDPVGSKTPDLKLSQSGNRARPKKSASDDILRTAFYGYDSSTTAKSKPNTIQASNKIGLTTPGARGPVTRSRGDSQLGPATPQPMGDSHSQGRDWKKSALNTNPATEFEPVPRKVKSAKEINGRLRAQNGRYIREHEGVRQMVKTRSAAARCPVNRSREAELDAQRKARANDPDEEGLDLDEGDMVFVYVDAYNVGNGKSLPSLRKVGPFELLRMTRSGHVAKLSVPEDYPLPDAFLTTSLTTKLDGDLRRKASSVRTAVKVETAPEKVLLKRIIKPLRRRWRQELEYSYLVKWINFPIAEATWEPATILEEYSSELRDDFDVPVLSNPFLLRNWKC